MINICWVKLSLENSKYVSAINFYYIILNINVFKIASSLLFLLLTLFSWLQPIQSLLSHDYCHDQTHNYIFHFYYNQHQFFINLNYH
jgi:hypothetical protein